MSSIFDDDTAVLNYAENRRPREDPESLLPYTTAASTSSANNSTDVITSRQRRASSAAQSQSSGSGTAGLLPRSGSIRSGGVNGTLDSPGAPAGPSRTDTTAASVAGGGGRARSATLLEQIGSSLGLGALTGADESYRTYRSGTISSTEDAFEQTVLSRLTYVRHWTHQFSRVNLRLYFQRLSKRAVFYLGAFIILSLCVMSKASKQNMLWGVYASQLYSFLFLFCIVDMGTTTVDHMIFFAIDNWWEGHFNIAYILHAFKGPLGLSLLIIIVSNGMEDMDVAKAMSNFNTIISGCIAVLICYSIKNYIQVCI